MKANGALFTMRAYASKGLFDILGVYPDRLEMVQVKATRKSEPPHIPNYELKALKRLKKSVRVDNIKVQIWTYCKGKLKVTDLK